MGRRSQLIGSGISFYNMNYSTEDILIMARTIYGEARSESYKGKKAVGHVIINRTNGAVSKHDHTISATCLRYKQFSCWNKGDPNRDRLMSVEITNSQFQGCIRAALDSMQEEDFTNGADHYHTSYIDTPYWAKGHQPCFEEGLHLFYKL